jgi:hypothetical protein
MRRPDASVDGVHPERFDPIGSRIVMLDCSPGRVQRASRQRLTEVQRSELGDPADDLPPDAADAN